MRLLYMYMYVLENLIIVSYKMFKINLEQYLRIMDFPYSCLLLDETRSIH